MQLSVWKHYIYFALKYIISINTFLFFKRFLSDFVYK